MATTKRNRGADEDVGRGNDQEEEHPENERKEKSRREVVDDGDEQKRVTEDKGDDDDGGGGDGSSNSSAAADDDNSSICSSHGAWDGDDDVPWRGCVCGTTHPRPAAVFWIQCDGVQCRAWYNVAVSCVGFDEDEAQSMGSWLCRECCQHDSTEQKDEGVEGLHLLLGLPDVLLYHILTFLAGPTDRAAALGRQIAPLCRTACRAVHDNNGYGSLSSLWSILLEKEYGGGTLPLKQVGGGSCSHSDEAASSSPFNSPSRVSKRQRIRSVRHRYADSPRDEVRISHQLLCDKTDDAHMALLAMSESEWEPLTLKRLRSVLTEFGPQLRINRRSPFGRTFLVEICAANYVDEGVILRCVRELVEVHDANPNVGTVHEYPDADRTPLFFAVARVMPTVVEYLLKVGSAWDVKATGRFRLVSNPRKSLPLRTYDPLGFARALREAEESTTESRGRLPSYYINKLNACIQILAKAEEEEMENDRRRRWTRRTKAEVGNRRLRQNRSVNL